MTSSRWEWLFAGGCHGWTVVGRSGHLQEVLVHEQ